ncbi:DNA polymerase beta superfamily protein [Microscilla marina]|nr:nucleotidyltransferase domain-containing protein [Microscilla marina]
MDTAYLKENHLLLLDSISGSKAYGLDGTHSDTDIRGVFILPKKTLYGMEYTPQVNNESNDITYYELKRFIELLAKNNPNILELLYIPTDCLIYEHPLFAKIKQVQVLSKLCRNTYGNYAMSQIKKARGLNKKIVNPMSPDRKTILDFCYIVYEQGSIPLRKWLKLRGFAQEQCGLVNIPHMRNMYAVYYDPSSQMGYRGVMQKENANDVILSSIPKGEKVVSYMSFNNDGYSSYCKDYKEYWQWVEERNDARYQGTLDHGKNYDAKNLMHTFRLLTMAEEIAKEGRLIVRRPDREFLLKIKKGEFEYDDLVKQAEERANNLDDLYAKADLPDTPDVVGLEKALVEIREEFYVIGKGGKPPVSPTKTAQDLVREKANTKSKEAASAQPQPKAKTKVEAKEPTTMDSTKEASKGDEGTTDK